MFGHHLTLDCYECDREVLCSEDFILNFLRNMVDVLDMHMIREPFIAPYEENHETWDKGGVSAVVLIAESHISIHTFPGNDGFACVDLFSCKQFDVEGAIQFVKDNLKPGKIDRNLFDRGEHFPKEKYLVSNIVKEQREEICGK